MKLLREYVVHSLLEYPALSRQIELLQYELSVLTDVAPEEMIEAMAFARGDGAGAAGSISDRTAGIALSYREKAEKANADIRTAILDQLRPLLLRKERLDRCVKHLPPVYHKVLSALYMQGNSIKSLATQMHISERTIQRYRDKAIGELVSMFELLEKAGVVLEARD